MLAIELHVVQEGRQSTEFLSAFCPTGGKMRLYGLLGEGGVWGASTYSCTKHVASPGACSPGEILILDLLLYAVWWNLGLFSHKHNLPFVCHYIIHLRVK